MYLISMISLVHYNQQIKKMKQQQQQNQNLYIVLGLESSASQQQIKKAYKKLAIIYHPDKQPSLAEEPTKDSNSSRAINRENSLNKFRSITEAYKTLGDSNKRREYDFQCMIRDEVRTWGREGTGDMVQEKATGLDDSSNGDKGNQFRGHTEEKRLHDKILREFMGRTNGQNSSNGMTQQNKDNNTYNYNQNHNNLNNDNTSNNANRTINSPQQGPKYPYTSYSTYSKIPSKQCFLDSQHQNQTSVVNQNSTPFHISPHQYRNHGGSSQVLSASVTTTTKTIDNNTVTVRKITKRMADGCKEVVEETYDRGRVVTKTYVEPKDGQGYKQFGNQG